MRKPRIRHPGVAAAVLLVAAAAVSAATQPPTGKQPSQPPQQQEGAVVSASAIASRIGADVLSAGGNVVDAAIATGFALAVAFDACFDAPGPVPAIERDIAEARRIGGRGTPTLVVSGMLMRPPYSEDALALQIEAALAEAGR